MILFGASLFVITTPAQIQAMRTAVSGTCSDGSKAYTDIHNGHVHIHDCSCPESGPKYYNKDVNGHLHEYFCPGQTPKPTPKSTPAAGITTKSTPTLNGGVLGITATDPNGGTNSSAATNAGVLGISTPNTGLASNPLPWTAAVFIVAGLLLVTISRVRRSVLALE